MLITIMRQIINSLLLCLFVCVMLDGAASASRIPMSQRDAWNNPDVFIVKVRVGSPLINKNIARYPVEVMKILKSGVGSIPNTITVVDAYYGSTARTLLRAGMDGVLFVKKNAGDEYSTYREMDLTDSIAARNVFRGLELFLKLIAIPEKEKQHRESVKAWKNSLSDPEKMAVLDVMWETRNEEYSNLLIDVAKGKAAPKVRSWAITILAYLGETSRDEDLVFLLDDPDYYVRRQALIFLGEHNVSKAVSKIEKMIEGEVKTEYPWQANDLKNEARRALVTITSKKPNQPTGGSGE